MWPSSSTTPKLDWMGHKFMLVTSMPFYPHGHLYPGTIVTTTGRFSSALKDPECKNIKPLDPRLLYIGITRPVRTGDEVGLSENEWLRVVDLLNSNQAIPVILEFNQRSAEKRLKALFLS